MDVQLSHTPVSVVIPCYKVSSFLERAVNSVINQTIRPTELILVDDASPDAGKSKELISKLEEIIVSSGFGISVITVFLQENRGPGGARNAGWEKATQPWVAFLDADDAWNLNKLELQYQCLQSDCGIDVLAHGSSLKRPGVIESSISELNNASTTRKISLSEMLLSNRLPTRSVILRREIPLRFPENTLSEDYSLWLQIISAGYDVRLMDCSLAYTFRPEYHHGGISAQLWLQERGELCAFLNLYQCAKIGFMTFLSVSAWSILKFIRRLIIRSLNF